MKAIPGCPDHYAADDGSIWSMRGALPRRLKEHTNRKGYRLVCIRRGPSHSAQVHRLVALAFFGEPAPGLQALHRDNDPANNRPTNLRWGTAAENSQQMVADGRQSQGSRHPSAKLAESDVRAIRTLRASGLRTGELAMRFGVAPSTISDIVSLKKWRHVKPEVAPCST